MATVTDYLTQLQTDKQTLVDNLVAKGVDATSDETFTSLVPKVADISGGGKYAPRFITFREYDGTELTEELANLDTSNMTSMASMFNYCTALTELDVSDFNTSNVTTMYGMFSTCRGLTELNVSNFDTSKVERMDSMFSSCSYLTSLNLSNFNTSSVTRMNGMFSQCTRLTSLDLSNFDTSKVELMDSMFSSCSKLTALPELDASSVVRVQNMFSTCTNLATFGGLKDLGKGYLTTTSANYSYYTLNLSACSSLTYDSLMNVINNLYDIKTAGCNTQSLILGTTNLAKLTEEEIAIATNKGWAVS